MNYVPLFQKIENHCLIGSCEDIDQVMDILNQADLPVTRAVDFYLGKLDNPKGIERLSRFLFEGTLIQRNYCTLFFARRNDWELINKAFDEGKIDWIQAYSR